MIVIWSWQNGKQYFEEINVYFVINGDLFENWLFAFEASRIAIWNIKHDQLDTDLQDYALTWGDKIITKQDLKVYVDALVKHIVTYLWNQRFLTQKCVNTAYLSRKWVNTAFLLRKFVNTAFFVAKFCKYALIDSFQGLPAVVDSSPSCAALLSLSLATCHLIASIWQMSPFFYLFFSDSCTWIFILFLCFFY